ncbi:late secretory pathway protein AVL9 homolog isoform X2 [Periophthalmus magnuspinnatus]|uniref:late secretory pathway protein AVL9 homolog isoform X2 n=1 Tax=Periophthalmus magnuspinnatus TaxID=409849 RepID=UPI00145B7FF6|nr:late secretory pathway protein AVL9 homolog isoform X2 [Periophthalmus magnuspinnatus]
MSMEMHEKDEANMGPVLHIVVVGFHHKKGCQVEFSYPPLVPDGEHDSGLIPDEWKYLPFLALPDGAHNYQEDTVYFHLPPLSADQKCVYGVSCYRQIEAKALKVRQADVTRETVQKSVCVLSRVPLYGLLQAKLQLITHAYFEEKDFSQISILKELYDHMNSSLRGSALEGSQVYLGLSPRDLILHFQHKVLILFKLILLEKKVLFYVSPVNRLVGALMTVLSLFPGLVEHGLVDSSHYKPRSSISEDTSVSPESGSAAEEFVSVSVTDLSEHEGSRDTGQSTNQRPERSEGAGTGTNQKKMPLTGANGDSCGDNNFLKPPSRTSPDSSESDWETLDPSVLDDTKDQTLDQPLEPDRYQIEQIPDAFESPTGTPITSQPLGGAGGVSQGLVSGLEEDQYGLPLAIFTKGYLCLPYMALQQHHLLSDISIRGFVAGATNILFRQQRHLSDVVIEVEEARIQTQDPDLRRALALTTADLRFVDYLVKHVTENRDDVFLDGTGWEGGDEWIRAQFTLYLHSLLASALHQDNERLLADYGAPFITAWKMTHNYRVWISNKHSGMTHITAGHPFQGQYSVADVKLRLSHSVQNSERGKKIGNAMMTTSRSMVQTGKAVGQSLEGALTSAKSAMSSWFSTLATPSSITHQSEPSAPPTDPPTEAQQ